MNRSPAWLTLGLLACSPLRGGSIALVGLATFAALTVGLVIVILLTAGHWPRR